MKAIRVQIDDTGNIHPIEPQVKLPTGDAVLTWPEKDDLYPALMSERSLSDWLTPEEDEAWAYLQPGK
jgi:hypothetical protein